MSSIVLQPTDEHEVIKILAGLSNSKSQGYIDITVTLLKESKFKSCKGGSKSKLSNYRPISILLSFNTCFEKHCINALLITERITIFSTIVNFALEKIIRPILLALICMKQFYKNKMTIDQFLFFFCEGI